MAVYGGVGGLTEGSAYYAQDPTSHSSSQEQIFSPIVVRKDGNADGMGFEIPEISPDATIGIYEGQHIGPTRAELDPYFSKFLGDSSTWAQQVDFICVANDTGAETNIRKLESEFSVARTTGFRGPMMLGGWGTDLSDKPVPSKGSEGFEVFQMLPEAPYDRSKWKYGPVDLKWDYERKVWSGGPQIVAGVLVGEIEKPESPCDPTTFIVEIYRYDSESNTGKFSNCHLNEYIEVKNFDPSLEQPAVEAMVWVVAVRLNYDWIPLWVGCPDPCDSDGSNPNLPSCPDTTACYCPDQMGADDPLNPSDGDDPDVPEDPPLE